MTDELIDRLTRGLTPVSRGVVMRRLVLVLAASTAFALVGMALWLGFRPDMWQALATRMFWMKLAYTLAFGVLGVWSIEQLSRPGGSAARRLVWLPVPLGLMALMAGVQLATAPAEAWPHLMMGASAAVCPWRIALTATPVFAALIWALRGLAPTRPRLAGAVAGLTAGGVGAAVYALHCPEVAAPFVMLWYSVGMLAPCVLGALVGPRLLRW